MGYEKERHLHFSSWRPLPGLWGIYLNTLLRSLGMGLVGIFIPLYIFRLSGRLADAFLFFALYHFFVILSGFPAAQLMRRIGVDKLSLFASLARALMLYFLILSQRSPWLVWPAAVVWGLTVSLCWLPYHYVVVGAENDDGKFGKEVGWIQIIGRLAGVLGPALGGVLLVNFGFGAVFWLALVLTAASGVPLLWDRYERKGMRLEFGRVFRTLWSRKEGRVWLAFFGSGVETAVYGVAWPIFMYLVLKNYEVLGGIRTAVLLASLLFAFLVGRFVDKKGVSIMRPAAALAAVSWFGRFAVSSGWGIFAIDAFYLLATLFVWIPFDASTYEKMGSERRLEFLLKREWAIHGGAFLTCLALAAMIGWGWGWFWIFAVGGLGLGLVLLWR